MPVKTLKNLLNNLNLANPPRKSINIITTRKINKIDLYRKVNEPKPQIDKDLKKSNKSKFLWYFDRNHMKKIVYLVILQKTKHLLK